MSGDHLVILRDETEQQRIPLGPAVVSIGRAPENSLNLRDPIVSRRHAEVRLEREGLILTDLGSSSGTFVNGERVPPNQPCRLPPGGAFTIGAYTLVFQPAILQSRSQADMTRELETTPRTPPPALVAISLLDNPPEITSRLPPPPQAPAAPLPQAPAAPPPRPAPVQPPPASIAAVPATPAATPTPAPVRPAMPPPGEQKAIAPSGSAVPPSPVRPVMPAPIPSSEQKAVAPSASAPASAPAPVAPAPAPAPVAPAPAPIAPAPVPARPVFTPRTPAGGGRPPAEPLESLAPPPRPPRPQFPPPVPENKSSMYLRFLPAIYQDDPYMGRFLKIFESLWEPMEWRQDHVDAYFNAGMAPASFLEWLASWFDIPVNRHWPEERLRRFVGEAFDLYTWRGTHYGLVRLIEVCTGLVPTIDNLPDVPFVFKVTLEGASALSVEERELVDELIRMHKPAHAGYFLELKP